ncbi:serine protease [Pseudomonas sp. SWRI77]|uniref:S1 family peptidase n=1 Tax=Pseudomonas sp. SWRI77 TaxID=2745485 RepID=UPI00164473FB|nr:serine protease [Pseudomonas sp. SWRI77]MBC3479971.1 trypsin-like peptidase domain-containing protein [Pseudomonas sp. SWRI77]
MSELSLAEQAVYSTVKLTAFKNGTAISTGTGFFYHFVNSETSTCPAIVTNKHVVNGADQILATCHIADKDKKPSGRFIDLKIPTSLATVNHPSSEIDLCALMISPLLQDAINKGTPVFYVTLDKKLIPETDDWQFFDAIENVTMIGCPNGISDEANNLPIVRRGITASSLRRNYNNKPEFVVDMACFPGSSGSPIFILDQSGYLDRKSNQYLMGATRLNLIGILYAGPLITNNGSIILAQTPRIEVAAMMHLGNCIKATELHAIDQLVESLSKNQ